MSLIPCFCFIVTICFMISLQSLNNLVFLHILHANDYFVHVFFFSFYGINKYISSTKPLVSGRTSEELYLVRNILEQVLRKSPNELICKNVPLEKVQPQALVFKTKEIVCTKKTMSKKVDTIWPLKLETHFICGQQWVTKKLIFNLMEIRFKFNCGVKTRRTNALFFSLFSIPPVAVHKQDRKKVAFEQDGPPSRHLPHKAFKQKRLYCLHPSISVPHSRRLGHFAFIPPPFISLAATLFRRQAGTQISKGNNQ